MGIFESKPSGTRQTGSCIGCLGRDTHNQDTFFGHTDSGEALQGRSIDKYWMGDVVGQGKSSCCWRATDTETGEDVALRIIEPADLDPATLGRARARFLHQITVLRDLQRPFERPTEQSLWSEQLAQADPECLFPALLDYSRDYSGQPGPRPGDETMYVVTELAQYTLKEYLDSLHYSHKTMPEKTVQEIARGLILIIAGLHAKGYVHCNLGPADFMFFNGYLKLVNVSNCRRTGTPVTADDSSVSFSPLYAAPEWARFLISEAGTEFSLSPSMDVWTVGWMICELVTLDSGPKPMFARFLRAGHSRTDASFLFLDWLAFVMKKPPLPKKVARFDPQLKDLLEHWLLVKDPGKRRTLAGSLQHPFVQDLGPSEQGSYQSEGNFIVVEDEPKPKPVVRSRSSDGCTKTQFQGVLYKLDHDGNPQDIAHWRKRDMWIADNCSLCYWSLKHSQRLVLIEGAKLHRAKVVPLTDSVRKHAFSLELQTEEEDDEYPCQFHFACASEEDYRTWEARLARAATIEDTVVAMQLCASLKSELDRFWLNIRNRRIVVGEGDQDDFAPHFKGPLRKLKTEGDPECEEAWVERAMWISKNGSLVYWSKREQRELVYYTAADIQSATFRELEDSQFNTLFAFEIQLAVNNDIEFFPGMFAAKSEEERRQWMAELQNCQLSKSCREAAEQAH